MELWLEYLIRRKLDKYIPKRQETYDLPIVVRRSYMTECQVWMYFLNTYRPIIRAAMPPIDRICSDWTRDWTHGLCAPTISEQKNILFRAMPHLETVWGKWQQCMLRSR